MTTGCFVIKHPVLHFPGVSGRVIVKKNVFGINQSGIDG